MSTENEWTPSVRRVSGGDIRERVQHVASLMREERFDDAHVELLEMLRQDSKSAQTRMLLGALYLRQEKEAEALDQLKQAIEIEPMQPQAHVWAGMCCLRLNDLDQAHSLLQTALDLDPKLTRAHLGMAQVSVQNGQPDQAMAHLDEALRLDPQMTQARLLRARVLNESGNVDRAIQELSSFLETNPDHAAASVRLAMMQAGQGNSEKSVELIEAVLESKPQSSRIWELLGRLKTSTGDHEGAERAFRKVIELEPQDRQTPLRLVDTLINQRKFDEAREILETVPRRGRLTARVHKAYGDLYAARQLYDDAIQSYRAAILHNPGGEQILAEIEAACGSDTASETMVQHFEAAFGKLREQNRKRDRGGSGRRPQGSRPSRGAAAPRRAEARVPALD